VVNNVEADHLECYGSVENLEAAFVEFAGRARRVFLGADDPGARRVGSRLGAKALYFGFENADLALSQVDQRPTRSTAQLSFPDGQKVELRLSVPGIHNLRNAAAALGVVWALDARLEPALEALAAYGGLGRRFRAAG
jgi:UDP-N-acetylmuramate--alanine ligase